MINGALLRDAIISAAITINNRKREVDELNVYPVPDGDTGTNMSMTIGNSVSELKRMPDSVTAGEVASAAASAFLRGARGNSGVILSLIFRGFSKGLSGCKEAGCDDFAKALELGVEAAYKAVMKPVEGTILTVSKAAATKARETAASTSDTTLFWHDVCEEAEKVLAQTTEMLPQLKKAGVVDAGGMGFTIIIKAMYAVFNGGAIAEPAEKPAVAETSVDSFKSAVSQYDADITFTYCTEFMLRKKENCPDPFMLRAYLETIGDCVVVVDDEKIIKVHVHTDNPGNALQKGLEFGYFINDPRPKIENMRIQHENKVKEAEAAEQGFVPAEPEKQYGFVAVAAGHGLEAMFTDLGADVVVKGGQTMNPSTDDILRAILSTPAKTVFVLPNNKNIIMAAEQCAPLTEKKVIVIPTKTVPQGITAMLNLDPDADAETIAAAFNEVIGGVHTALVTYAARNSEYDGKKIKAGEYLSLLDGALLGSWSSQKVLTRQLCKALKKLTPEFITIYYGEGVPPDAAEALREALSQSFPEVEVTLVDGGQPVYYYMISVE